MYGVRDIEFCFGRVRSLSIYYFWLALVEGNQKKVKAVGLEWSKMMVMLYTTNLYIKVDTTMYEAGRRYAFSCHPCDVGVTLCVPVIRTCLLPVTATQK